jgi:acetylornithine deacetylase
MTAVEHLLNLIRIPSVSVQTNRAVIDYAKHALRQAGWYSREVSYLDPSGIEKVNLIAAPSGQDLAETNVDLAFVCHTDTVPYATAWTQAVEPYEQNGFVHGCGACDVKGFLASLLFAVENTPASAIAEGVRIILTADEEVGCVGASRLIASDQIKPRRMVIGEPTSLHPARAGKGYALAEFTIHGREAHSALPASGVSAIYGAAKLIAAIEQYSFQLQTRQNPVFKPPFTTVNIGTIEGGSAKNIIAGSCRFLLEWRPIPNQDPDEVFRAVTAIADGMAGSDPTFKYSAKRQRLQLGFETKAESPLVLAVQTICTKDPTSIAFGSEASFFAPIAEQVIVFGPGDMQTAHSDRECVPIKELEMAAECIRQLMASARAF